jgi:hypothetical protein
LVICSIGVCVWLIALGRIKISLLVQLCGKGEVSALFFS